MYPAVCKRRYNVTDEHPMIKSQKGKPNLRALNRTMSASASDE